VTLYAGRHDFAKYGIKGCLQTRFIRWVNCPLNALNALNALSPLSAIEIEGGFDRTSSGADTDLHVVSLQGFFGLVPMQIVS